MTGSRIFPVGLLLSNFPAVLRILCMNVCSQTDHMFYQNAVPKGVLKLFSVSMMLSRHCLAYYVVSI